MFDVKGNLLSLYLIYCDISALLFSFVYLQKIIECHTLLLPSKTAVRRISNEAWQPCLDKNNEDNEQNKKR